MKSSHVWIDLIRTPHHHCSVEGIESLRAGGQSDAQLILNAKLHSLTVKKDRWYTLLHLGHFFRILQSVIKHARSTKSKAMKALKPLPLTRFEQL